MRILVIEDEPKIARSIKRALEQEGYAVDVCLDSDEGYAMATNEPYDAAIIDRMLPGDYTGLEIVGAMRDQAISTPVLILTALGTIKDKTDGLDGGADDYLVKPFAIEELLSRIRALLRRPKPQHSTTLQVGSLRFDTSQRQLYRDNREITLTAKEYALLEYLMRHPGQALSKDTLIAHVWDFDADILPNTVEVYIRYLRSKIDIPGQPPLIHTVRGIGYKIEANDA